MKSGFRYLIHDRSRATRLPLTPFPGWKPRLRFRTVCPDGSLYLMLLEKHAVEILRRPAA